MWSEHCSYKSSRIHLKKLPTKGPRVLQGPGENAGAVDIGDGLAAVFKIESHNHPSFIEPYQGAATGVGGIIRDIFTMGARPIALLNSLRFGRMDGPDRRTHPPHRRRRRRRHRRLRQLHRHPDHRRRDRLRGAATRATRSSTSCASASRRRTRSSRARAVRRRQSRSTTSAPRPAATASTARRWRRRSSTSSSAEKRPAVQVGDPFMEKLLLEACLELMADRRAHRRPGHGRRRAHLLDLRDGRARRHRHRDRRGARAAARNRHDAVRDHAVRIAGAHAARRQAAAAKRRSSAIFDKWDLHAAHIGEVTDDGLLRVKNHGEVVAEIPNTALVDEAPVYDRPTTRPAYLDEVQTLRSGRRCSRVAPQRRAARAAGLADHRQQALGLPAVRPHGPHQHARARRAWAPASCASRARRARWRSRPTATAATATSIRAAARCSPSPRRRATSPAPARVPIGATNCLNFGNPERPEIMWQFAQAVEGIADACRALDIPITGGNVSLYNETDGKAIYPTPVIGVVGLIEDASRVLGALVPSRPDAMSCCSARAGRARRQRVSEDGARHGRRCSHRSSTSSASARCIELLVAARRRAAARSRRTTAPTAALAVTLAECASTPAASAATSTCRAAGRRRVDWRRLRHAVRRIGVARRRVGAARG